MWHAADCFNIEDQIPEFWQPGDVIGSLIDFNKKEVVFSLNGKALRASKKLFEEQPKDVGGASTGYFAAASFMAFQQCKFNFGSEPFKHPPAECAFSSFNQFGAMTEEERHILPK